MLRIIGDRFERSQHYKAWTPNDVFALKQKGFTKANKISGSSFGFHMVKPAKAIVIFETESGKTFEVDMREEILRFYGLKLLKKERFQRFMGDVYSKKLVIYNENGEFKIERVKP